MAYIFQPPPTPAARIAGSDALFPVRRVFCVGRNYADHVKEMGADPKSEPPIFFTKPADAVVADGAAIAYAQNTAHLHHEVELVLALGAGGADIPEANAPRCIWGYGVGVDLTRRDRQAEAKQAGAPWDVAKAFDQSAPLGPLTPVEQVGMLDVGRIWLSVNGAIRQDADIADMIWRPADIIAQLSRSFALKAGDLIFTGTPAGVGALAPGDDVRCGVAGLAELSFSIAAR